MTHQAANSRTMPHLCCRLNLLAHHTTRIHNHNRNRSSSRIIRHGTRHRSVDIRITQSKAWI